MNKEKEFIPTTVHTLYHTHDTNCARTTLYCLGQMFEVEIGDQLWAAAAGMHGAGGFRAQCGLVEGALMFIGIYGARIGLDEEKIVKLCYDYGEQFTKRFGSLRCAELRPGGFREDDPPHLCEGLTCRTIEFAYEFVKNITATGV